MSTFWKNMNRVAQDQLFTRGYLSAETVAAIAARRQAAEAQEHAGKAPTKREGRQPWPRLAALR